ncbi:hypothetical protein AMATHDRAFT_60805 [Amanita thiersii Skay4041]|uniref:Protein kinase domain-containing protein n=1 Tax=Amanita thiersii Skay4041 TaxID=703135 RepID=A0A2A9NQL6_9AGAR|nr:hypothetical protein AMATHDRAFT_60805 [Amanita thiersii Skay4041]
MISMLQLVSTSGLKIASAAAGYAPIPALVPAIDLLCGIIELCENVSHNQNTARTLIERCDRLVVLINEGKLNTPKKIEEQVALLYSCLSGIKFRLKKVIDKGWLERFAKQKDIALAIEACHTEISICLEQLQVTSHLMIHSWQREFAESAKKDHDELLEKLADIEVSQKLSEAEARKQTELMKQMMGMMQQLLGENKQAAERRHQGISSNLYQFQKQSGLLLPKFQLDSGEVKRTSDHPVGTTSSGMDIYEGIYLGCEKVAIKVVRSVNANDASNKRFNREVDIWCSLWERDQGRHIVPFYGYNTSDGPYPYMVSPWHEQGHALAFVQKYDKLVNYHDLIEGIARGIEILHTMQPPIVHGDLQATNIFISDEGKPLLADFGLSKIVAEINGVPLTQSRGISSSYRWMAPELCTGEAIMSTSSDIYSFAMTVLELMTHQQPYANIKRTTEVVLKIYEGKLPERPNNWNAMRRGLTDEMWELLTACWAAEPKNRPSIQEVLNRLS